SVTIGGLNANTTYYFRVTSADAASNSTTAPTPAASFVTGAPTAVSVTDTTAADFNAGARDAGIYVQTAADGGLTLTPSVANEFTGTTLPTGWSVVAWNPGGTVTVAAGQAQTDGARFSLDATSPVGQRLEFAATFSADTFEHVGFGLTFNETPWA